MGDHFARLLRRAGLGVFPPDVQAEVKEQREVDIDSAVDLEVHDGRCAGRFGHSAFRYHLCSVCGETVDTFGGNVD